MKQIQTQVLVVGGSLVGLSAALFLAAKGVDAITIERHATSSPHPRAIGYTPRTMELLRAVGLGDAFPEMPASFRLRRVRVMSLAGERMEESEWTPGKPVINDVVPLSPVRGIAVAQDRVEPALRNRARELGADVRQSTELVAFHQDSDGVTARVRQRDTGDETIIRADYMIAADGGDSAIRDELNITRSGRGHIRYVRSVLFRANLDEYLKEGISQWEIEQPGLKAFMTTYQDGRWVLMFTDDIERETDVLLASIKKAIGRDDLAIEIITTGRWDMSALVADRFSSGRIFLAGDAAHQLPPTRGGYGANTGIQDVHNLAWKLAAVLDGSSTPALLETYDMERRPVAWVRHQQIFARPDYAKDADGWAKCEPIRDDDAMEFGQLYRSTSVIGAGQDLPAARRPDEWNGQPGVRAPHFPVVKNGTTCSFIDLLQRGWLLVSANPEWRIATHAAPLRKHAIEVAVAGEDFFPTGGADLGIALGIGPAGAALIRPDGIVAWRTTFSADSASSLGAFTQVAATVGGQHVLRAAK